MPETKRGIEVRPESTDMGFPVINSEHPTEQIVRLQEAMDKREIVLRPAEPELVVTDFIGTDFTHKVERTFTHKVNDEPGEFDGNYLVRVFKGLPYPLLLVSQEHIAKRQK